MTGRQNKSPPAHTPEPWKLSDDGLGVWSDNEPLGRNKIIASCGAVSRDDEENRANARLIVNAPKLLKALEDAFTLLDRIADTLHYEDGLPVTALESREIEDIYSDAICELAPFETLIRQARGQQ